MKTWHIVLIVGACVVGMLTTIGVVLLVTSTEQHPTKEQVVVSQVQAKYPQATNWPSNTIINIARETCADLDRGDSIDSTIMSIASRYPAGAESDYDLIAFTMVTGIKEMCPRHIDQARRFANGG